MTLDEMVEEIDATGDQFTSLVRTNTGAFQANCRSRYGSNAYGIGHGDSPTSAVADLHRTRVGLTIPEIFNPEDLI